MKNFDAEEHKIIMLCIQSLESRFNDQREKIDELEQRIEAIESSIASDKEGEEEEDEEDDDESCCCGELVPTSMLIRFDRRDIE